jgi:hypothetical protein
MSAVAPLSNEYRTLNQKRLSENSRAPMGPVGPRMSRIGPVTASGGIDGTREETQVLLWDPFLLLVSDETRSTSVLGGGNAFTPNFWKSPRPVASGLTVETGAPLTRAPLNGRDA